MRQSKVRESYDTRMMVGLIFGGHGAVSLFCHMQHASATSYTRAVATIKKTCAKIFRSVKELRKKGTGVESDRQVQQVLSRHVSRVAPRL
jgi:hypothetical protein